MNLKGCQIGTKFKNISIIDAHYNIINSTDRHSDIQVRVQNRQRLHSAPAAHICGYPSIKIFQFLILAGKFFKTPGNQMKRKFSALQQKMVEIFCF